MDALFRGIWQPLSVGFGVEIEKIEYCLIEQRFFLQTTIWYLIRPNTSVVAF
jgi:hypothetical protein